MATFRDILNYYRPYRAIAIFSIAAASIFEIIDLVVPYAIGQVLNVLSLSKLDGEIQHLIESIAVLTNTQVNQFLSLTVLLGLIFIVTCS
jgi:ATP-binding cassette subfamily B protein